MNISLRTATFGLAGLCLAGLAAAQDITGAGATFPAPLYAKWAADYNKATGVKINYQSVGSGAGIKQIDSKTVAFGASDMPLKDEELAKKGQMQFPTVIGGVVPVINIKGIAPGQLKLNGQVLGDIYLGKITKWTDPAIKALNPSLPLPDAAIAPVRRADGSGTTLHLHQLPVQGEHRVENQGGRGHGRELAGRRRRQGQRGRRRLRQPPAQFDRLRRVRVRQAEQDDLCPDAERGGQFRLARRHGLQGRRRRCRLGQELLPDPHQPAGQGRLADHRAPRSS